MQFPRWQRDGLPAGEYGVQAAAAVPVGERQWQDQGAPLSIVNRICRFRKVRLVAAVSSPGNCSICQLTSPDQATYALSGARTLQY